MRTLHAHPRPRLHSAGLSLIELMIAMTIGLLLVIGMIQIFSASRATYQMQDGVARIQENGRFITQFLQKQLRMGGFMGCGSDLERGRQMTFVNHMDTYAGNTVDDAHRFQRPVEGFAAEDAPTTLFPSGHGPMTGTDVLVLRTASADSVPVLDVSQDAGHLILTATLGVDATNLFSDSSGAAIPYFLENCRSSDVFVGTLTGTSLVANGKSTENIYLDPSVTTCDLAGNCPWDFRISNAYLNAPNGGIVKTDSGDFVPSSKQLNAEVHRADFTMVYVAENTTTHQPALYVLQSSHKADALADPEEMADGIEALKFLYGVDTNNDGQVDKYQKAAEVAAGATSAALDEKWGQVLSIRIGMLLRSPESAPGATKPEHGYKVLGTDITDTPDDGHLRQVYETTIAVRNRVFTS